jgi:Bacterial Ig domain
LVFVSTTTPGSPGVFDATICNFEIMKTGTILAIFVTLLISCSKNSTGEKDTVPPVINLTSPVNGQIFTAGQLIQISGSITDNNYIAEVHIHVSNLNTGSLLMDVHLYPGNSNATFNQSITAVSGINYKIQVIAKDREVNEASATVNVSSN